MNMAYGTFQVNWFNEVICQGKKIIRLSEIWDWDNYRWSKAEQLDSFLLKVGFLGTVYWIVTSGNFG